MMNQNIVKQTAKELGMTYKELAERIGVSEGTLKQNASKDEVAKPLTRALELYTETIELKTEINKTNDLKELLKNFIK